MLVTCNGCFDGIHPGHLFFLGFCRAQADRLVVGINTDEYIAQNKREKPFYNMMDRKKALLALGFVDDVVVFGESTPNDWLKRLKPDVHCTGEEYGEDCPESSVCKELDIKLVLVPRIKYWATSELEDKSLELMQCYMNRLLYEG